MAVSDVLALTVPALLAGVGLYGALTGTDVFFLSFLFLFCSLDSSVSPLSGGTLLPFPDSSKKMPSPAYAVGGHCMFKIPITFFPVRSRR